jgi:Ran GTPase-activating protein (RanGAP) involved in mRNA processing and transport
MMIKNKGLHRIDLSDNGLRTVGFVELMQAMQLNDRLFRLDLKNNAVGAVQAESALVAMLATNKCLVIVDIAGTTLEVTPAIEAAM